MSPSSRRPWWSLARADLGKVCTADSGISAVYASLIGCRFERHAVLFALPRGVEHRALKYSDRRGGAKAQQAGQNTDSFEPCVDVVDRFLDETDPQRLLGAHALAGAAKPHRLGWANEGREFGGSPGAWHDAQARLRKGEARLRGGEAVVASQEKLNAPSKRHTMCEGDSEDREPAHPLHQASLADDMGFDPGIVPVGSLGNVGARDEDRLPLSTSTTAGGADAGNRSLVFHEITQRREGLESRASDFVGLSVVQI